MCICMLLPFVHGSGFKAGLEILERQFLYPSWGKITNGLIILTLENKYVEIFRGHTSDMALGRGPSLHIVPTANRKSG